MMSRNDTIVPARDRGLPRNPSRGGLLHEARALPLSPSSHHAAHPRAPAMRPNGTLRLCLSALALLAAACDHPHAPQELPDDRIVLVKAAPDAPPLETQHVSFWAKAGDTRHVEIRYESDSSYSGDRCLEFTVPSNGLYRMPDGRVMQKGDSVLITVDVVDPMRFDFRFSPSGLQFDPRHPAEMRVSYKWVAKDANGDGVEDDRDRALLLALAIWRQEAPGQPWTRLSTDRSGDAQELRADIPGFSQYAMAGGN